MKRAAMKRGGGGEETRMWASGKKEGCAWQGKKQERRDRERAGEMAGQVCACGPGTRTRDMRSATVHALLAHPLVSPNHSPLSQLTHPLTHSPTHPPPAL